MTNKTLAILSYVTIIGWLVSYFQTKDQAPKTPLVKYHLKQGLGLFIVAIIFKFPVYKQYNYLNCLFKFMVCKFKERET